MEGLMALEIQWYPGHMAKAKRLLSSQLGKVDLVVELCDARLPLSSRNPALDELIRARLKGAIPDRALTEKTYRYLAGKGFAPGEIRSALRRYTRGEDFDA